MLVRGISLLVAQLFVIAIENILRWDVGNLTSFRDRSQYSLFDSYVLMCSIIKNPARCDPFTAPRNTMEQIKVFSECLAIVFVESNTCDRTVSKSIVI